MRVFVAVVDRGSQIRGADSSSCRGRWCRAIWRNWRTGSGARLMHRTTRKFSLTAAGNEICRAAGRCSSCRADMPAASANLMTRRRAAAHHVSTSFGQAQLADAMAEYVMRYPGVASTCRCSTAR